MTTTPHTPADALNQIYKTGIQLQFIKSEIASLAALLDDEDPGVAQHGIEQLEVLLASQDNQSGAMAQSVDQALALADLLIGQAATRRAMAKRLLEYARADEAKVERLQQVAINVAKTMLLQPGKKRIDLPLHVLQSRKSTSVVIDEDDLDIDALPEEVVRVKKEVDKNAAEKLLKSGASLPGLRLEDRVNWTVAGPRLSA